MFRHRRELAIHEDPAGLLNTVLSEMQQLHQPPSKGLGSSKMANVAHSSYSSLLAQVSSPMR